MRYLTCAGVLLACGLLFLIPRRLESVSSDPREYMMHEGFLARVNRQTGDFQGRLEREWLEWDLLRMRVDTERLRQENQMRRLQLEKLRAPGLEWDTEAFETFFRACSTEEQERSRAEREGREWTTQESDDLWISGSSGDAPNFDVSARNEKGNTRLES
jgi:hypothetical protein